MDPQNSSIDALLNLLEDEDNYVSSMAMERLLSSGEDINALVAEFQESHNPVLRSRIHQLGNIIRIRESRYEFVEGVRNSSMSLWDGVLQINFQYNQRMDWRQVKETMSALCKQLPRRLSTVGLAEFMRRENFAFTGEDIVGPDLYLIEDVLLHRIGSPILLSVIAKQLGEKRDLQIDIGLYKGKFCIVDRFNNLVDPSVDWKLAHLSSRQDCRFFGKLNIWLVILCQLFTSSILEGRLHGIHRIAFLLAKICGGNMRSFPFPLGS